MSDEGREGKINFFDAAADHWKTEIGEREEGILRLLSVRLQQFPVRSEFVLDIGCGTGVLFPYLAGWKIIGLDFSLRMLDRAKKNEQGSVSLVDADAQFLPFREDTFGHVIFFSALPHIEDKLQALRESHRVLKRGGTVAILHLKEATEINVVHSSVGGPIGKDRLPEIGELSTLVEQAGFEILQTHSRGYYFLHAQKAPCTLGRNLCTRGR